MIPVVYSSLLSILAQPVRFFHRFSRHDVFVLTFFCVSPLNERGTSRRKFEISVLSTVSPRRLAFICSPFPGYARNLSASTCSFSCDTTCVGVELSTSHPTRLGTFRLDFWNALGRYRESEPIAVVVDLCSNAFSFYRTFPFPLSWDGIGIWKDRQ